MVAKVNRITKVEQGTTVMPEDPAASPLSAAGDRVLASLERLENVIQVLEKRLGPVLGPGKEVAVLEEAKKTKPISSQLVADLCRIQAIIGRCEERIGALLGRLEV